MKLRGNCQIEQTSKERDIEFGLTEGDDFKIGVSLCTQSNMTSLAARLRRLLEIQKSQSNPWHRLILIRHPQTPIGDNARACRNYWDELQQNDAVVLHPSLKTIAALNALRELLATAKAGDLSFSGDAMPLKTVEEWLRRELPDSLCELVASIAGPSKIDSTDFLDWNQFTTVLNEEFLLSLVEAAERRVAANRCWSPSANRIPNTWGLSKAAIPTNRRCSIAWNASFCFIQGSAGIELTTGGKLTADRKKIEGL